MPTGILSWFLFVCGEKMDEFNKINESWDGDDIQLKPEQPKFEQPKSEPTLPAEEIQQVKKPSIVFVVLKTIGVFVGVFIFVYLFLTFPALYEKLKYWVGHLGKREQPQEIVIPENIDASGTDLFLSSIQSALKTEKPTMPKREEERSDEREDGSSIDIFDLENNHLIIPKLDKKVPIIWNSPPDEKIMLKNLENGVVHYNGTGLPDEGKGNVFISGHSSNYWWDKGHYKTVFANLGKLNKGDEVALAYENKVYLYRVYEKFEVKPEQVDVLDPVGEPILSLMTCVPVGTNLKRLIIRAKRIKVDVKKEEPIKPEPAPTAIPTTIPTTSPTGLNPLNIINLLPWRW